MNRPKPTSLLVYLDESPGGAAAIELAIAWAARFEALVVGLGVVNEPLLHGPRPEHPMLPSYQAAYQQLVSEARHDVEQRLDRFSRRCLEAGVSYKLLEDEGTPAELLLREAQRFDLLLLGRDARLGMRLGEEKVEHFLRCAPRPLIAVPEKPALAGNVVVAYDGSPEAARALYAFAASGLDQLGAVHVLSLDEESSVRAAKTADLAVEFLRFHHVAATPAPRVGSGAPGALEIHEAACRLQAGLVVMGACGQTRLHEYLLGSVTRGMLRESAIPLFLFH